MNPSLVENDRVFYRENVPSCLEKVNSEMDIASLKEAYRSIKKYSYPHGIIVFGKTKQI